MNIDKKNKLGISIVIVGILFFFYVLYKSLILNNNNLHNYYLPYYILSILISFLGFIFFFIKKEIQTNIFISILSLIFALYLIEIFLTIPNKKKSKLYKINTGKLYDERSKVEAYVDFLKEDPSSATSIFPQYLLKDKKINFFPLSGISNVFTLGCNENGYFSFFKSDRYGFNNNDIEWDKEIIEYLIIGDSFSAGSCVNYENTIQGNLSNLSNEGVISLGYGGKGPLTELATLIEYLPRKKINKILWIYYEGNDLGDLKNELKNKILIKYLNDENFFQNLITKENEINLLYRDKISLYLEKELERKKKSNFEKIFKFLKLFKTRYVITTTLKENNKDFSPNLIELREILRRANKIASKNNSKLYFVYLPSKDSYVKSEKKNYYYNNVLNIVKKLDIPIINLYEDFLDKLEDPKSVIPLRQRGHLNELGYKMVSHIIHNRLSKVDEN